jgi:thiamine pyrophosphate-dependent acetolactate synthase large subunit-like protein
LQDIDQFELIKPHVKWSTHIASVKDVVPALEEGFMVAASGTPGPIFIEIPLDVLYRKVWSFESKKS